MRSRPDHPRASAGCVAEHVLLAEQALGRYLPDGAEVHHVDGNVTNNTGSNLVICQDKAYHKLLHYRAKVLRAGGNPNTDKFCRDCQICKPLEKFNRMAQNKSTGRQSVCRDCARIRDEAKRRRNREVAA
jgi:hypothetical protein